MRSSVQDGSSSASASAASSDVLDPELAEVDFESESSFDKNQKTTDE